MKATLLSGFVLGVLLSSGVAHAAYGAIACDSAGSGYCSAVASYADQSRAVEAAINLCQRGGYTCYLYQWEFNECIYGPNGSYACD